MQFALIRLRCVAPKNIVQNNVSLLAEGQSSRYAHQLKVLDHGLQIRSTIFERMLAGRGYLIHSLPKTISLYFHHTCFYCRIKRGLFTLDRIDNAIGYIRTNVVYACWVCNVFRSSLFSPDEMKVLGPALRNVRAMRGHNESDYYLLGLGNTLKKAAMFNSRSLPHRSRISFPPGKRGR